MTHLDISTARRELFDTVNRVAYGKENIVLCRRGKDMAILVPIEYLPLLEEMEERLEVEAAEAAEVEAASKGETPIPWKEASTMLDL